MSGGLCAGAVWDGRQRPDREGMYITAPLVPQSTHPSADRPKGVINRRVGAANGPYSPVDQTHLAGAVTRVRRTFPAWREPRSPSLPVH